MTHINKQELDKKNKHPRRWGWFILLYASSLGVMAIVSGILEFIVNHLH